MIGCIHESPSNADDEQHDRHLQDDDDTIDKCRFLRAANKQEREQQQDHYCRDVHNPVHAGVVRDFERRMRPLVRDAHSKPVEHAIRVLAPRDRDRRRANRVFENQIPADDPRDQLTHGRVRIGVGAACHGNHGGELRVTKARKRAADRLRQ